MLPWLISVIVPIFPTWTPSITAVGAPVQLHYLVDLLAFEIEHGIIDLDVRTGFYRCSRHEALAIIVFVLVLVLSDYLVDLSLCGLGLLFYQDLAVFVYAYRIVLAAHCYEVVEADGVLRLFHDLAIDADSSALYDPVGFGSVGRELQLLEQQ